VGFANRNTLLLEKNSWDFSLKVVWLSADTFIANTDNTKNKLCKDCKFYEFDTNLVRYYGIELCSFCLSHTCQKCGVIRGEKKRKKGWKLRMLPVGSFTRPVCPECVKELRLLWGIKVFLGFKTFDSLSPFCYKGFSQFGGEREKRNVRSSS